MIRTLLVVTFALAVAACGAGDVEPATVSSTVTTVAESTTTTVGLPATSTTILEEVPPSTEPPPTTTTTAEPGINALEFVVADGEVADLRAVLGEEVRITIHSDQTDEAHLHGYDIHADVGPGSPGVIEFVAAIPGIFEIEFESNGSLIAELRVDP